jgi:adenosylcobinamide-phosphate synthase
MTFAWMLMAALALDALTGEPKMLWSRLPHPAVLMGRAVGFVDERFNDGSVRAGGLSLAALVIGAAVLGCVITALPLGWLWSVLIVSVLLAQRSLVDHVRAVGEALSLSLGDGRLAVGRIVGRDTSDMDEPAIARAAIESAAENLSDGVIAPAFWFLIAGLPGIMVYKMVNTADSMIGYRSERYEAFGKAAAKLDDVLNWLPARLTALILAALGPGLGAWGAIRDDAQLHRSPNAGWPEAAMARSLDVALSGPRSYEGMQQDFPWLHAKGERSPDSNTIARAAAMLWSAWVGFACLVACLAIFPVVW